jgi:DNA-binding HxlR family transcriptional regulator
VEYSLTTWGKALCQALDAILKWTDLRQPSSVEQIYLLTTNAPG